MWSSMICTVLLAALSIHPATVSARTSLQRTKDGIQQPVVHASKSSRTTDLVNLHRNLTEISSISGNELEVGKWLEGSLKSQGYHVELQKVDKERYNVLAWPGDKLGPRVLLTSHIDTVPPFIPYHRSKDDIISGRGSVDAKAAVAAMIVAANSLLDSDEIVPNDFALLFVVGEETVGDGMKKANSLDLKPKHVIFGEPTEGKLASGHKGILLFNIHAYGKAAHSGYPWLGRSANQILVRALAALDDLESRLPSDDKFGNSTINFGCIEGGVAANVVPESAKAQVAIRLASGTPKEIEKLVAETVEAAVRPLRKGKEKIVDIDFLGGYTTVDLDVDVPGFDSVVVNYGTDVPNFNMSVPGQKRYLYGPGSIFVAHGDHEALALKDLEQAVEDYKRLILHSLQI